MDTVAWGPQVALSLLRGPGRTGGWRRCPWVEAGNRTCILMQMTAFAFFFPVPRGVSLYSHYREFLAPCWSRGGEGSAVVMTIPLQGGICIPFIASAGRQGNQTYSASMRVSSASSSTTPASASLAPRTSAAASSSLPSSSSTSARCLRTSSASSVFWACVCCSSARSPDWCRARTGCVWPARMVAGGRVCGLCENQS